MPDDYTTSQMMADIMAVVQDNVPVIIQVAVVVAVVALVLRWFMYAVNIGDWTFGGRR